MALLLTLLNAPTANAQGYPFSQRSTLTQNIALTKITVTYGRPVARGRVLFGGLVPWDSVWHPGADSATRVTISRDVLLGGRPLKAGVYSLWLIPRAAAPWTLILSRAAYVDHKAYAGPQRDALRLELTPDSLSHMESMAIYFPMVLRDEGTMRIHWGTSSVSVSIKAPYKPD